MDIEFKATYQNEETHTFTVHISEEKGQGITDAFIMASRTAGSFCESPIVELKRIKE